MEFRINVETEIARPASARGEVSPRAASSAPRVGVVCDFREENWHSMNLVADMLLEGLRENHAVEFDAVRVCPPMRRRFTREGVAAASGVLFNADRLMNRFFDYPRFLQGKARDFDLFHVVDHSYAHLLQGLPAERAIVTCHDLDTFRCLLRPETEARSAAFRAMTRRVLEGFRKAARVACDSHATRDELLAHHLLAPERVVVIPNGVHPSMTQEANDDADGEAARLLGPRDESSVELLHVGSSIARKRIDVLLKVFAAVRERFPRARLVRVGGQFDAAQAALVERLKLGGSLVELPYLEADVLAAVYRRAALALLPSEREGFGLPLVEALRCGTFVVASDLPVLREVGGDGAVAFRPVGDVSAWSDEVIRLLRERARDKEAWARRRDAGVLHASQFTWDAYVRNVVALYRDLLGA